MILSSPHIPHLTNQVFSQPFYPLTTTARADWIGSPKPWPFGPGMVIGRGVRSWAQVGVFVAFLMKYWRINYLRRSFLCYINIPQRLHILLHIKYYDIFRAIEALDRNLNNWFTALQAIHNGNGWRKPCLSVMFPCIPSSNTFEFPSWQVTV